jgi:uncharacterized protein DUF3298
MWRPTLPPKVATGDFNCVRIAVVILISCALVVTAGCTQTNASRSPLEAKPTAAALAAPGNSPHPNTKPVHSTRIDKTWANELIASERSIRLHDFEKDGYGLEAKYPQLESDEREVRRFNKWIKKKVLGYVHEFKTLADAEQRRKAKIKPQLWALSLSYDIYYSTPRLVSLRLTHEVMEAGQMHPIAYYETINFDLKRGRQLRAKDVFKRGYLKQLSNYSRKYLVDHYDIPDQRWLDRGTEGKVDNFVNWNIVPEGVLLSFEDYQVSSHSFGQPEFVVPFSALQGTLRQNVLRTLVVSK